MRFTSGPGLAHLIIGRKPEGQLVLSTGSPLVLLCFVLFFVVVVVVLFGFVWFFFQNGAHGKTWDEFLPAPHPASLFLLASVPGARCC